MIDFFDTDPDTANAIIDAMVEQGLIAEAPETQDQQPVAYAVTDLGVRFSAARLLKPIPRPRRIGLFGICSLASRT